MFYPEKEEGETALGLDGETNNATDCDWENYLRAIKIWAPTEPFFNSLLGSSSLPTCNASTSSVSAFCHIRKQ